MIKQLETLSYDLMIFFSAPYPRFVVFPSVHVHRDLEHDLQLTNITDNFPSYHAGYNVTSKLKFALKAFCF